ncbi:MAG TPA: hypothetical protein VGB97_01325 [Candidatus Paceibacterota bacterium]|jgi:hypothetical protein
MATIAATTPADFLRHRLAELGADTCMAFVYLRELREAAANPELGYDDMVRAATEVGSQGFNLTPRIGSDNFSEEPYLWITPSPKPVDLVDGQAVLPDKFWVIGRPGGGASLRVAEGLLVFSHPGLATGHMITRGQGDFNVNPCSKSVLLKDGHYKSVVLDYAAGHPLAVIPITD